MSGISASIQLSAPVAAPRLKLRAACLICSGVKVFLAVAVLSALRIWLLIMRKVSSQRWASSHCQWPFQVFAWCFRISFGSLMYLLGWAGVVSVAGDASMRMVLGR